jgi:hypothetical protein
MIEWIKEFYLIGVLCGGVSLLFTMVGGWAIMRGIETLRGDIDEQSTTSGFDEDEETENLD